MSKTIKLSKRMVSLALIILLLVIVLGLYLLNKHSKQTTVAIPTISTKSTSSPKSSNPASKDTGAQVSPTSDNTSSGSKSPNTSPAPAQGASLLAPYGSFVSNHRPGANGSPTIEESVCNTTPGASCYIQFVKDGSTKKLDTKTADSTGSAVWDWNIKDAGFSSGSWQISATATLNGQSKTTVDTSGNLEVSP